MDLYSLLIDDNDETGVYTVSFVDQPAVETNAVYLSSNNFSAIKLSDEPLRQTITACALRPDFPIYRKDESGHEYYIQFSKEEIFKIASKFFKEKNTDSTNFEHFIPASGNYVIESWFSTGANDKSFQLGITDSEGKPLPEGSWIMTYKVPDLEQYQLIVQNKKAFSIEGLFNQLKISASLKKYFEDRDKEEVNIPVKKEEGYIKRIYDFTKSFVNLNHVTTADGLVISINEYDLMPWFSSPDLVRGTPVPEGEYELNDGSILIVENTNGDDFPRVTGVEEPKKKTKSKTKTKTKMSTQEETVLVPVEEIENVQTEASLIEQTETNLADQPATDAPATEDKDQMISDLKAKVAELEKENEDLKAKLSGESQTNAELKTQVEQLKAEPAAPAINTAPVAQVDLSKMTVAERIAFNAQQFTK